MSVWADIHRRSNGIAVKKEDEHWGIIEITKCTTRGERFVEAFGMRIPGEKIGKVFYFNVNWRVVDSRDIDNKNKEWWYFRDSIVVEGDDRYDQKKVKERFLEYVKELEKEGRLDPILMDDGHYEMSEMNEQRIQKMQQKIIDDNKMIIFG